MLGVVSPRRSRRPLLCAADDPNRWRSPRTTSSPSGDSSIASPPPGSESAARASFWPSRGASGSRRSPPPISATRPRSGAPADDTAAWGSTGCSRRRSGRGARPGFPPLQRAQIVELACLEPVARGLHVTHWSSAALARQAVCDGIVTSVNPATVRRILNEVDLQPHRTRYWRTVRLDDQFKERAEKVLWCYANADRLARRGVYVVCADEMPNLQILERMPIRRAVPGSIEQREFAYVRHGTVNLLMFLVVHIGKMRVTFLEHNDAESYVWALKQFRADYGHLRGVYLIHDGGPSHSAAATGEYLSSLGDWWHSRRTPAHASWLNQSELLNNAFGGRYLKRGSWPDRRAFTEHIRASGLEYNRLFAHPFEWTWTNQKMRAWFAKHST